MFATLTERVPITLVNTYLAVHLWTGDHTVRATPSPNGHFLVSYLWITNGLSLLTICLSIAEFEASEAIDFEIADISQSSGYYFALIAYRFAELSSRMIFLACVGTTFMSFVILFDMFAMTFSSLGFWGTMLVGPWLTAVMFVPLTTIDIWRLRKFLPQYWVVKALEAFVMVLFAIIVHEQLVRFDVDKELQATLFKMSETQRSMIYIGIALWLSQYMLLYLVLHIGHKYYARAVPAPKEVFKAVDKMFTVSCGYTRKRKKQKSPLKKNKVQPQSQITDIETGKSALAGVTKQVVLEDYASSGDEGKAEMTRAATTASPAAVTKAAKSKKNNIVAGAALGALLEKSVEVEKPKAVKRKKSKLKRKGTMML